ncbi:MAG: ImmA/IrrE family metallo-endopeptidase [Chitinophagales bacterium]
MKGAADLAGILRKNWNLGDSPLANVIDLLELKGVKVLLIDAPEEIDGFAAYTTDGVPLIVINPLGKSVERIRFTVIHELAHYY